MGFHNFIKVNIIYKLCISINDTGNYKKILEEIFAKIWTNVQPFQPLHVSRCEVSSFNCLGEGAIKIFRNKGINHLIFIMAFV